MTARDGEEALETFARESFDLVILDIMLPHVDGMEVCRRIRAQSIVPIIMLTAKSDEFDKVLGLEIGADDYITKDKFSLREFRSRVRAQLRRAEMSRSAEAATKDVIKVDEPGGRPAQAQRRGARRQGRPHLHRVRDPQDAHLAPRPRLQPPAPPAARLGRLRLPRRAHGGRAHPPPAREARDGPKDPEFIFTVRNIGYKFREF